MPAQLDLALALRDAGLVWRPAQGDRFIVLERDLDEEIFVLSDMVVEVIDSFVGERQLGFNGTTEWALDSVGVSEAVWLPREDQLREMLGGAFGALESLEGPTPGWVVTTDQEGIRARHVDVTAEAAYARAVLAMLAAG